MNNLFEFGRVAHDLIKQTSHCHLQVLCQIYDLSLGGSTSAICIEYSFGANVQKALLTALASAGRYESSPAVCSHLLLRSLVNLRTVLGSSKKNESFHI